MKNFIEELFYGNIDPQARGYVKDSNIKKILDSATDIEEKLTKMLNDEEKGLFLDFVNAHSEIMGEASLDSFIIGFRLGARFMYDTFVSEEAPFYDFLK